MLSFAPVLFFFLHSPLIWTVMIESVNLKMITPLFECVCADRGELDSGKFFAPPPLLLYRPPLIFFFHCKSLSFLCNPLWCSHVCWSRARGGVGLLQLEAHTHWRTYTAYIYTLKCFPSTVWGTTRMCQGASMLTVKSLSGLQGTCSVAQGQGKPPFLLLQSCIEGRLFTQHPGLLSHFLTLLCWRDVGIVERSEPVWLVRGRNKRENI